MIPVRGLNHAVLLVRDLARSREFYTTVLGFGVVSQGDGLVLLRAAGSDNHHDLGLIALGDRAQVPPPNAIGLYHLAWEVPTVEALATAVPVLSARGALVGISDHGVSRSVYGRDPDDHEFELMWRVPRAEWGEAAHQVVTRSLNLVAELSAPRSRLDLWQDRSGQH